jgi:two-component system, chemotaxis family, chemotaxis protein CheY
MDILNHNDYKTLLGYLPHVKTSLKEWLFVDIRITDISDKDLTVANAAQSVRALFREREGKLYICNDREILMIVRWGKNTPPSMVADSVSKALPEKGCAVFVHEPTVAGLSKLEILITYKKPTTTPTFSDIRVARRENVVIIADDDMFMRSLVKKGIGANFTVVEVPDGAGVMDAYKKSNPDVLFLDIHMPNVEGTSLLQQILAIDPNAYIVMLSADSSRENVESTAQKGARGFLTKPFTKERLQECLNKCLTIS